MTTDILSTPFTKNLHMTDVPDAIDLDVGNMALKSLCVVEIGLFVTVVFFMPPQISGEGVSSLQFQVIKIASRATNMP